MLMFENDDMRFATKLKDIVSLVKVVKQRPMMGCDPEFFFEGSNGNIVGAEKVIPPEGIETFIPVRPFNYTEKQWLEYKTQNSSKVIVDGVACEINPRPQQCRAYLANDIRLCFQNLRDTFAKNKVKPKLGQTMVEISPEELASLDEKNKQFGCAPSENLYRPSAKIEADPLTYRKRGAGGHIHLGIGHLWKTSPSIYKVEDLVRLLDIVVGNTCVLLDRNPDNIERRKNYGRAGEYRLPAHGIEYRTLSNFWLTAYPLMSFVFGMSRYATEVYMDQSSNGRKIQKLLLEAVSSEDIENAIQGNNFDLALRNFLKYSPIIIATCAEDEHNVLTPATYDSFFWFIDKIYEKGLGYWFSKDPFEHWCNLRDGHYDGAYQFLLSTVAQDMKKEQKFPVKV